MGNSQCESYAQFVNIESFMRFMGEIFSISVITACSSILPDTFSTPCASNVHKGGQSDPQV